MAENVTTKQETMAAIRKCSGVHCPLWPLNSTGDEKVIFGFSTPFGGNESVASNFP
jgi:hypothetical protein